MVRIVGSVIAFVGAAFLFGFA